MAQAIILSENTIFCTDHYVPEQVSSMRRTGDVIDHNGLVTRRSYHIRLVNDKILLFQTQYQNHAPYAVTQFATYHEFHEIPDELFDIITSSDRESVYLGFDLIYNFLHPKYQDTINKRKAPSY